MGDSGRELLRRFIDQRRELGEKLWCLGTHDPERVLGLLRSAGAEPEPPRRPALASAAPGPSSPYTSRDAATGATARAEVPGRATDTGPADLRRSDDERLPDDYAELRALALDCRRCGLSETRTQVVFSDGSRDARLMVVGEAPGAQEDETGLPFVGAAGQYLDLLLETVGLSREDSVYICNVLKCRPPGNRNPEPDEIRACAPYLHKQIELVRPGAILAVGSFAARLLTGTEKAALGTLRGTVHEYRGVPLVVTYHPAALLRNANWTRAFWEDLQVLRGVLDGPGA